MFAQIIVNLPGISGTFDYRILPELERQVEPGCLVEVPFGKQMVQGVVLSLSEESAISDTKYIVALLDSRPVVTPLQMQLAQRMSEQTLAPLAACVDFMLPPGLSQQADTLYSLGGQTQNPSEKRVTGFSAENLSGVEKRLLNLLEKRGPLRGRQVNAALSRLEWKSSSKSLVKKGLILARPVLPPPAVRPKFVRTARIACSPAELSVYMVQQKDSATSRRRSAVLRYLLEEPLPVAVQWVYAASGATLPDLKELAELDLIQLSESEVWRDPLENIIPPPAEMPLLTHEQQEAWDKIRSSLEKANTGSHPPPIPA